MNLKTCLFDKSTIKSDFKRFWWVSVIYMVLTALFILPRAVTKNEYYVHGGWDFSYVTDNGIFALLFAFLLGGMIFSYLHKGNAVSCFHGLPLTRKKLYFSHIFAGFVILFIPIAITSGVIAIESLYLGATISYAVKYLYTCLVYAGVVFMVTVFSSMISGNTVATYIFSIGFMALPGFVLYFTQWILNINLYGFNGYLEGYIYNYIYITGVNDMWSYKSLWYVVLIAVVFVFTYVFYKNRKLENYDDIVVFKYLKPVFMYTLAVCFGVFGYMVIYEVADCSNLFLGTLPLGCVALIAAFMLNRKSFGIRGLFKPLAVFVICLGAVSLGFAADITGYERRIPAVGDIESIDTYGNNDYHAMNVLNTEPEDVNLNDLLYKEYVTDKSEIENIVDLHRAVVENRIESSDYTEIPIVYNLKGGKQLKRTYKVDNKAFAEYLKPYYENTVYKKYRFPLVNDREKDISYVEYSGLNVRNSIKLDSVYNERFYDAVKKDVADLKYKDININNNIENGITLYVYYDEYAEYEGGKAKLSCCQPISLDKNFKNTRTVLKEALVPYSNSLISSDTISSAYLEVFGYTDATFTLNADEARKIYNYFADMAYADENISNNKTVSFQITFDTDGEDVSQYFEMPYSQLPDEIRRYVDNSGAMVKQ